MSELQRLLQRSLRCLTPSTGVLGLLLFLACPTQPTWGEIAGEHPAGPPPLASAHSLDHDSELLRTPRTIAAAQVPEASRAGLTAPTLDTIGLIALGSFLAVSAHLASRRMRAKNMLAKSTS
jgi:hypothetical protein